MSTYRQKIVLYKIVFTKKFGAPRKYVITVENYNIMKHYLKKIDNITGYKKRHLKVKTKK